MTKLLAVLTHENTTQRALACLEQFNECQQVIDPFFGSLESDSFDGGHKNSSALKLVYTPRGTRFPIISLYEQDAMEISARLMSEKVKVTGRKAHGGHIRVSPHFYNTKGDIGHFIEKMEELSPP